MLLTWLEVVYLTSNQGHAHRPTVLCAEKQDSAPSLALAKEKGKSRGLKKHRKRGVCHCAQKIFVRNDHFSSMSLRTKIIKYVIAHKSISLRTKIVKYVIAHKMDKISIFRKINLSSSTFQLYHAYSIKFHQLKYHSQLTTNGDFTYFFYWKAKMYAVRKNWDPDRTRTSKIF